ncbi:MAG: amino acid racemase [Verrucomicrobiae bacterium]|nr:amino acid racemase [Verrucomicrobiae bacterium]
MNLGSTIESPALRTSAAALRKFGLIGGTSWRSTVEYYSAINGAINRLHGDNTNPRLNVASVDQRRIHKAQSEDDWEAISDILRDAALELQLTGVEGLAVCANTPHKVFDAIQAELHVPLLHIGDAVARECAGNGWNDVGLLGTRFTMEDGFLRDRLRHRHGIRTRVPAGPARRAIHRCVIDKLSVGDFDDEARALLGDQIEKLAAAGAEAVVLGCTEFPLLMEGSSCSLPLIDSLACHCDQIVRFIIGEA